MAESPRVPATFDTFDRSEGDLYLGGGSESWASDGTWGVFDGATVTPSPDSSGSALAAAGANLMEMVEGSLAQACRDGAKAIVVEWTTSTDDGPGVQVARWLTFGAAADAKRQAADLIAQAQPGTSVELRLL